MDPQEILDFSANINPLGPSRNALEAIKENLWRLPYYPEPDSETLRREIADHVSISPESIIIGNGSTEIIHLFAEWCLKERGEILIPQPTFSEYESASHRFKGKPRFLFPTSDIPSLPIDRIERELDSTIRAVFICNPNNPTGELNEKEKILRIVEKAGQKGIPILIDETFIEFSPREEETTMIDLSPDLQNLIVLRSFTKIYALTGLRVGFGVGSASMIEPILKMKEPWNVNCLAEIAASASMKDTEYIKKTKRIIEREKELLMKNLDRIEGLEPFPSETNFILISTRETGKTAHELQSRLAQRGIIVRDCSSFRGLNRFYIRIAVRLREENERLLKALEEILQ